MKNYTLSLDERDIAILKQYGNLSETIREIIREHMIREHTLHTLITSVPSTADALIDQATADEQAAVERQVAQDKLARFKEIYEDLRQHRIVAIDSGDPDLAQKIEVEMKNLHVEIEKLSKVQ